LFWQYYATGNKPIVQTMSLNNNEDNSSPSDKSNTVLLDTEKDLGTNNPLVSPQNDIDVAAESKNEPTPVLNIEVLPSKEPTKISFSGPTSVQLCTSAIGKQNAAHKFIERLVVVDKTGLTLFFFQQFNGAMTYG
jgi:hypothetical protein